MQERLAVFRALLENPSDNLTATAVGIIIVVLLFLLVTAVLLAWAYGGRARPRSSSGKAATTKPRRKLSQRSWTGVTIALGLVALAAGYGTTSASSYCGSVCHAMGASNDTWRASAHSKIACVRCHEGLPVLSAPAALVSRSHSLYMGVAGGTSGMSAVPAGRCLGCHRSIARQVVVGKNGVAMAHEQVLGAGAACDDCHGQQGHEKASREVPMASCLPCHDGQKASAECKTCHREPADTLLKPIDTRFGKVSLPEPTCGGCHSEATCDGCHGLRMPHPATFADPAKHAALAAFERKDALCYRCHVFADCNSCHLPFNAHVSGWKGVHATYPRGTRWCLGCHTTNDMCGLCHK